MELLSTTWVVAVVVVVKEFSALYPKGSVGLGVTGVLIVAWLTTGLPTGIVGM
jgi:hypothetical protein